jgi:hypothetical protein
MEKEFVPYEMALRMKLLGYDEPCLAGYNFKDRRAGQFTYPSAREPNTTSKARIYHKDKKIVGAPTFSQAFRWFREKYNLDSRFHTYTHHKDGNRTDYMHDFIDGKKTSFDGFEKTYEEAELACLENLLEIVEQKQK